LVTRRGIDSFRLSQTGSAVEHADQSLRMGLVRAFAIFLGDTKNLADPDAVSEHVVTESTELPKRLARLDERSQHGALALLHATRELELLLAGEQRLPCKAAEVEPVRLAPRALFGGPRANLRPRRPPAPHRR
jgi:hypothetical protein